MRFVETARIGVLAIDVELNECTAPVGYQTLGRKLSTATPLAGSPISRTTTSSPASSCAPSERVAKVRITLDR